MGNKKDFQVLENKILVLEEQALAATKKEYLLRRKLNETQELSNIGSWDWHIGKNIVEWSDMMFTLLGLSPDTKSISYELPSYALALFHVHDEDKKKYEEVLGEALANNKSYYLENRIQKKDKSIISVISRGTCICDDQNNVIRMVGTVQDVTEQIKYIESNIRLEQYANLVAHDLKSPLRTISNYIGLLKRNTLSKLNEKEINYFDFINSAAKQLATLVDDMLNYSRLNSTELDLTNISFPAFIKSIEVGLEVDLKEKKGTLVTENIPDFIIADQIKIRQVFQNLISNAIKFAHPDRALFISIRCEETEQAFQFFIKDNGVGLKEEEGVNIFEPYKQLKQKDKYQGTGMGLFICKNIINRHGGTIGYDLNKDFGASFFFTLPKKV